MIALTFSKSGQEDIVLTEDDLFDFDYEKNAYSGETFELGGVCARSIYLLIDNNTQRFSRGTFANTRIKLEIDGHFYGYYNAELPKRRNGVIELTAYDDMVKLDVEFPTDYLFPQTFWSVYAQCVFEAGLAADISFDNVILNGVWDNGIISADYTDYIYANSCRQLVAGMAEWNGGFAHINDDGKLQVDKFGTNIVREYSSGELMELDYSDETVVFSKVKTSQKNKTYEKGDDSGYTLVLNNQYISYGLDDTAFETYLTQIYDYYKGFSLTPMSFTLAEPDFGLDVGDRVQVYDEEEQVTITGNVSRIEISGNCSMVVTCGGFENVSSSTNFKPTSASQNEQTKAGTGTAEKLQTSGSNISVVTRTHDDTWGDVNGIFVGEDDSIIAAILAFATSLQIRLGNYPGELESQLSQIKLKENGVELSAGKAGTLSIDKYGTNGAKLKYECNSLNFELSIPNRTKIRWTFQMFSNGDSGFFIHHNYGNGYIQFGQGDIAKKLEFVDSRLLFNGKKVLLQE